MVGGVLFQELLIAFYYTPHASSVGEYIVVGLKNFFVPV